MKTFSSALIALLVICGAVSVAGQDEPKPVHRHSFIETRQGNSPEGPDVTGHASVSKDDTLQCVSVEVYDATHQASTACVVKFKDGTKRTLAGGQFMRVPEDGEFSLECSGHVPRRCVVEVNAPVSKVAK